MRPPRFRVAARTATLLVALAAGLPAAAQSCRSDGANDAVTLAWQRYLDALAYEVHELDASVWPARTSTVSASRRELDRALARLGAPFGSMAGNVDHAVWVREAFRRCVAQLD